MFAFVALKLMTQVGAMRGPAPRSGVGSRPLNVQGTDEQKQPDKAEQKHDHVLSRKPLPRISTLLRQRVNINPMDAYSVYRTRSTELMVERAFNFRWTPEVERSGEEDLMTLWESLTSDEQADLVTWIAMQEGSDIEA
jgi:hypothetical protein